VKERLVGAAVLTAAAVILIPEMLSGPAQRETPPANERAGAFKTVTIDLNRSPGSQPIPESAVVAEAAPPPEEMSPSPQSTQSAQVVPPSTSAAAENPLPRPQTTPESRREEPARSPTSVSRAAESPSRQPSSAPSTTQAKAAATKPATPAPVVSRSTVPTTSGWAVQLGSFSNRATADRLVKDFAGSGYNAFVMPVQSGGSTLYRVRIGPFPERAAANDALTVIKKRVGNAAVVAHP
jgi:DedD protein